MEAGHLCEVLKEKALRIKETFILQLGFLSVMLTDLAYDCCTEIGHKLVGCIRLLYLHAYSFTKYSILPYSDFLQNYTVAASFCAQMYCCKMLHSQSRIQEKPPLVQPHIPELKCVYLQCYNF